MNAKQAKIAIYGAGAMGTVLGALLTKGGLHNVHLITRNQAHVDGLNKIGAQLLIEAEEKEWTIPVQACTPNQMSGQYDVVFLMTKQRQNEDILQCLSPYLSKESIVCTTQNGLPEQSVASVVGNERTYGGVASFGATFIGGGKVALTSKFSGMRMQVSGFENSGDKTGLLLEILSYVGKAIGKEDFAQKAENLLGARWSKLAINAAFSGLSVVTGKTFGELATARKSKKAVLAILRECITVANALGVELEKMQGHDMQKMLGGGGFFKNAFAYFALPIAMKNHKKLISGMYKDVENGRKCEIDYINGAVIKAGKMACVPTPYNEKVVEIVHGIENGLYEISMQNLDFFEEIN